MATQEKISGSGNSLSIDWAKLEEVVERAVKKARAEELGELAEAIKTLAEYMKIGFDKIFETLEKHSKILEQHSKILEEHSKILEEHSKILKEHSKILEEHSRILEQHTKILESHSKALARIEASIGSLGRRMGMDLERTILNIYKEGLESMGIEPRRVEKITFKDIEGRYYRKGAKLEIDIYVHDNKAYFIEVKSLAEVEDIEWFEEKCNIFERILGRKPDGKIVVALNIDREALERAMELGIKAIYGNVLEETDLLPALEGTPAHL